MNYRETTVVHNRKQRGAEWRMPKATSEEKETANARTWANDQCTVRHTKYVSFIWHVENLLVGHERVSGPTLVTSHESPNKTFLTE